MKIKNDFEYMKNQVSIAKKKQEKILDNINKAYDVYNEINSAWESSAKETFTKEMEEFFSILACFNQQIKCINKYTEKYIENFNNLNEAYGQEKIDLK